MLRALGGTDQAHDLLGERRRQPAADVLGGRDGLEVVGVDAVALTAEVVEMEACRNRATLALVDVAMRGGALVGASVDAVAVGALATEPDVARGLVAAIFLADGP